MNITRLLALFGGILLMVGCTEKDLEFEEEITNPEVKSGVFSVSALKKVRIAPSNLSVSGRGFTTRSYYVGARFKDNRTSPYEDWGDNIPGKWRTLTYREWMYLLTERDSAQYKAVFCAIRDVEAIPGKQASGGWLLLPDEWHSSKRLRDNYSVAELEEMEDLGAVFIPTGSYRIKVSLRHYEGCYSWSYWSSTFGRRIVYEDGHFVDWGYDDYQACVRLVADIAEYDSNLFSISDTTKVLIAEEDFQWNGRSSFCWGTGNDPDYYSDDPEDFQTFVDWGINVPGNWRTLSAPEWDYVLSGRDNAEKLALMGKVNGLHGLILLPDNWKTPSGCALNSAEDNPFTTEQWRKMEKAGAVFFGVARFWSSSEENHSCAKAWEVDVRGYHDQCDGIEKNERCNVRLAQDRAPVCIPTKRQQRK